MSAEAEVIIVRLADGSAYSLVGTHWNDLVINEQAPGPVAITVYNDNRHIASFNPASVDAIYFDADVTLLEDEE